MHEDYYDERVLKKLQRIELGILKDFDSLCKKHGLQYFLVGGSAIGVVRHQGFIPWDDDIDLIMTRENYNLFKEKFLNEFADKYEVCEPLCDKEFVSKMIKVYKKDTVFIELPTAGTNKYHMLFLDIFILENISDNLFKRKIDGAIHNFAHKAASLCIDYKYPSKPILEKAKENEEVKKYYKFRRRLGFIFAHIGGMRFYLKICNKIERKYENKETKCYAIPSSGLGYLKEVFSKEEILPTIEMDFCNVKVKVPKIYDKYLSNLYGDYMKIPEPEKRERHSAYKVEF